MPSMTPTPLRPDAHHGDPGAEARLNRGPMSEAERPWRAVVLTLAGGALVLFFAASIGAYLGPSGLATNLPRFGQVLGLVVTILGVSMAMFPGATRVLGPFLMIAGILAFPIAFGAALIGSVCLIMGGALAFAWMPAPPAARLRVRAAPTAWRLGALSIDLVLFGIVVLVFASKILNAEMRDSAVVRYGIELAVWLALVLPGATRGFTPGKLMTRVRVCAIGTIDPPRASRALLRECMRTIEGAACAAALVWVTATQGWRIAGTMAVVIAIATALLGGRRRWAPHDLLAGTHVIAGRVVVPPEALGVVTLVPRVEDDPAEAGEPARAARSGAADGTTCSPGSSA